MFLYVKGEELDLLGLWTFGVGVGVCAISLRECGRMEEEESGVWRREGEKEGATGGQ